jgi:uncharacterized repeat protein (TIGR03806 family)
MSCEVPNDGHSGGVGFDFRAFPLLCFLACPLVTAKETLSTSSMPAEPPQQSMSLADRFPTLASFAKPIALATPPGETNRLFVAQKDGDLVVIPNLGAPSKSVFLDLDGLVNGRSGEVFQTSSEQGLLGLAFHPSYASNGWFYVVYSLNINSLRYQRLSRFTVSAGNANLADTASEKILIEQRNEAGNHNGGDVHFGPDGYLYMSWGDEGNSNDSLSNSQRINKDFWSSIIRIDVDLEPEDYTVSDGTGTDDANIRPNAHAAVKLDAGGNPRYEIPADNPFIGFTSFGGSSFLATSVRTEFYAIGLRNPFRFSFDPADGTLWCGDVGQGAREEIDRIVKGGNYEWAFKEGFITGPKAKPSGLTNLQPPVIDYPRGNGATQGSSVTGGVVYRGEKIPGIIGKYIYADYVSGNIWSLDDSGAAPVIERLTGESGIVGFGYDPTDGEILMADLNSGKVRKLVGQEITGTFPQTLAATGLFSDAATLSPATGLIAYGVNLPFWSDHAIKRRWFGIPDPDAMVGFSAEGNWTFPQGMLWVKHFDLETVRGDPATRKRLETRVLVRNSEGSYGVSYRWNEAGTSASLAAPEGEEFDVSITENGSPVTQRWRIPSRASCITCHSPQAGHALSFRTRQLNRPGEIGGVSGNFLTLLADEGYLGNLDTAPANLPRHAAPGETEIAIEERARAYLDVNCAYCHNDGGSVPAQWDSRSALPLFETGMVNGIPGNGIEHPSDRLIVPGLDQRSVIVHRVAARNGYTRMPPLGSNVIDHEGVQLLTDWINGDLISRVSYEDWRESNFGSPPVGGAPEEDDDSDGRTNHDEFLAMTDPKTPDARPGPLLVAGEGEISLTLPTLPGRSVFLEESVDLVEWNLWDAPGNNGLPRASGDPFTFSVPMDAPGNFFRARIMER